MKPEIYLAPLSGVSDLAFRLISREHGAQFCFFEMIAAKALVYSHAKTLGLLKTNKLDKPIAAQLLGRDPDVMLDAAHRLINIADISFLDVNCGCPVNKVIKNHSGAYLLQDTKTLHAILKKLTSNLKIPVTVKIRTGFDKKSVTAAQKIAKICEDSGASKLFVHGRIKSQGYSGDVDYEAIRSIKEVLKIPVFGSGNIFNGVLAKKMLDDTGCDGILVARGALGNPWAFHGIETYLKTGKAAKAPTRLERKKILIKHLSYIKKYKELSEMGKVGFMRKITMWYAKGFPGAKEMRKAICSADNYKNLLSVARKF